MNVIEYIIIICKFLLIARATVCVFLLRLCRDRAEGVKDRANSTRQALDESEKAIKKAAEALNVAQANLNGTRDATAQVDLCSLSRLAKAFAKFAPPDPTPWPRRWTSD